METIMAGLVLTVAVLLVVASGICVVGLGFFVSTMILDDIKKRRV